MANEKQCLQGISSGGVGRILSYTDRASSEQAVRVEALIQRFLVGISPYQVLDLAQTGHNTSPEVFNCQQDKTSDKCR